MFTDTDSILSAAARMGMAHNNGAGGEFILVGTEAQLTRFAQELGSLEGLQHALLNPPPVVRDENGYWSNPALPVTDESVRMKPLAQALGLELTWVDAENQANDATMEAMSHAGTISAWTPTSPEGNGWVPLSIHDTEDGPVAMYVRRPTSAGGPPSDEQLAKRQQLINETMDLVHAYADAAVGWERKSTAGNARAQVDAAGALRLHVERIASKLMFATRRVHGISEDDFLRAHALEELCQLGYRIEGDRLIPPENLHELMAAAKHPLALQALKDQPQVIGVDLATGPDCSAFLLSDAARARLFETLESAKNGLEWYRDALPAADSVADDEMHAAIDEALALLSVPQGDPT